jgi:hypothetical protein
MSTDIHTLLSQITRKLPPYIPPGTSTTSPLTNPTPADVLLNLFRISLVFVDAGEDDNPEGLRDRLSSFVAAREEFPEWGSFSAVEQAVVERLVAPENREVLLHEGWRCECCYGRR